MMMIDNDRWGEPKQIVSCQNKVAISKVVSTLWHMVEDEYKINQHPRPSSAYHPRHKFLRFCPAFCRRGAKQAQQQK